MEEKITHQEIVQFLKSERRPSIAVVAGCGSLQSLGILALFEYLESMHIPIDAIFGCSAGATACALWGAGADIKEIITEIEEYMEAEGNILEKLNYKTLAGMLGLPVPFTSDMALFHGDNIYNLCRSHFGNKKVEDCRVPFAIQATDLLTGEGVIIEEGPLDEAVYASCALYPYFPPIEINNRLLVDGGYSDPLPVLMPIRRRFDIIIVMSVGVKLTSPPDDFVSHAVYFFNQVNGHVESAHQGISALTHDYEVVFIHHGFDKVTNIWRTDQLAWIMDEAKNVVRSYEDYIFSVISKFYKINRSF